MNYETTEHSMTVDPQTLVVLRAALVRAHDTICEAQKALGHSACGGRGSDAPDCGALHEAILIVNEISEATGGLTGLDFYDATDEYNKAHHYPGLPADECLEFAAGGCSGRVEYRPSLSGTGTQIRRCDAHWEKAVQQDAEHRTVFPDSPIAPAWFDPTAAGERWDEDY
jgi:hypothetical protein